MAEHDDRTEVETADTPQEQVAQDQAWQEDPDATVVHVAATEDTPPAAQDTSPATEGTPPATWDDDAIYRTAAGAAAPVAAAAAEEDARAASVRREQERLAAERQARREARIAALNPQPTPVTEATAIAAPTAVAAPVQPSVTRRTTDRFLPSLGLFLLRLVVAAILGVRGMDMLLNVQRASEVFASTVLPQPQLLALITGAAQVGIAIALVFGIATRLAGLGTAVIAGGTLAFVLWGPWSPFVAGQPGFVGELELLLAAVGVLFVTTGAGGWAIDRGFRARRAADKAARANLAAA